MSFLKALKMKRKGSQLEAEVESTLGGKDLETKPKRHSDTASYHRDDAKTLVTDENNTKSGEKEEEFDKKSLDEDIRKDVEENKSGLEEPSGSQADDLEKGSPGEPSTKDPPIGNSDNQLQEQTNLLPRKALIIVFCGLALAIVLPMLDQTQVATSLPRISQDFKAGKESTWVATAYLLTSTSFQPLFGRFSDIFGRKRVMLFSLANFFVWTLACGVAQSMTQLIVFRAFAGIGGGGIISLTMIIISDVVSLRDRGKYQGFIGVTIAFANGVGPTLGGVLAEKATWRWSFFINLPLSIIASLVVIFALPLRHVKGEFKEKLLKIDYGGSILITCGSVLLLLSLNWGGVEYPWDSGIVLGILVASIGIFAIFLMWEWKAARIPIIPLRIFRNATISGVLATSLGNGHIFYTSLFFVPQLYQVLRGYSPITSGLLLLPLMSIQAVASLVSGLIVSRTGRYKVNILLGWAIWTVGVGLVSTLDEHSTPGQAVGYLLLSGIGAGQTFQTTLIAAQASVPRKEMSVVTSVRNFIRQLGGTIGLAIASTILNNSLRSHLRGANFSEQLISSILDDPASIQDATTSLTAAQKAAAIAGYRQGFRVIFLIATAVAGLSFFVSLFFIAEVTLRREDEKELKAKSKLWLEEKKRKAVEKEKKDADERGREQQA
ncbi:MFS general substrate transporter [Atractiella rhizophila]|nr:MFS general substrate transporter [Atractiella rhizophila]